MVPVHITKVSLAILALLFVSASAIPMPVYRYDTAPCKVTTNEPKGVGEKLSRADTKYEANYFRGRHNLTDEVSVILYGGDSAYISKDNSVPAVYVVDYILQNGKAVQTKYELEFEVCKIENAEKWKSITQVMFYKDGSSDDNGDKGEKGEKGGKGEKGKEGGGHKHGNGSEESFS